MSTQDPTETTDLKLPDISLDSLPEATKDFIIAYSSTGKTIPEVIREVLDRAAANSGFTSNPKSA